MNAVFVLEIWVSIDTLLEVNEPVARYKSARPLDDISLSCKVITLFTFNDPSIVKSTKLEEMSNVPDW